jgi:predicted small metal-binding protein
MFLSSNVIVILMAGQSEAEIRAEEEYREYLCREQYKNKECGFSVRAPTEGEVIEHARIHQEQAHGMKAMTPERESKIRENIKSVPMVESKEFECTEPGCGFSVRADAEDEIIEHAHMHQELEHSTKESLPETRARIKGEIRPIRVPVM